MSEYGWWVQPVTDWGVAGRQDTFRVLLSGAGSQKHQVACRPSAILHGKPAKILWQMHSRPISEEASKSWEDATGGWQSLCSCAPR